MIILGCHGLVDVHRLVTREAIGSTLFLGELIGDTAHLIGRIARLLENLLKGLINGLIVVLGLTACGRVSFVGIFFHH